MERKPRDEAKRRATAIAGGAKRRGKLIAEPCMHCGSVTNVQMHHEDYSKPLDVLWVCQSCHQRIHVNEKWWRTNVTGYPDEGYA